VAPGSIDRLQRVIRCRVGWLNELSFITSTEAWGMPREQEMLKGHLPISPNILAYEEKRKGCDASARLQTHIPTHLPVFRDRGGGGVGVDKGGLDTRARVGIEKRRERERCTEGPVRFPSVSRSCFWVRIQGFTRK
jgi:hypothetical protein